MWSKNTGDILKLHDICHNQKCKCKKQITFTLMQFQLEGAGFKNTMQIVFKGTGKMWNNFVKSGLKKATPNFSAGFTANLKSSQSAEKTSSFLQLFTGGKNLSLEYLRGIGLRLVVM